MRILFNIAISMLLLLTLGVPSYAGGGSGWSSATAISPTNLPDPTRGSQLNDVAVNANGLTVAVWDQFGSYNNGTYNWTATIEVAVQSAGRWGAPLTISNNTTGYATTPKVAVGADGTVAVSWVYQDDSTSTLNPQQKVQVAVRPAGSTTWSTSTLDQSTIGGVAIVVPALVGIDNAGNVTAAWTQWDGAKHVVKAATRLTGIDSSWSTPNTISDVGHDGLYISLAVNANGDAGVAYSLSPYTTYSTGTNAQYVFRSGPSGLWSTPRQISETLMSWFGYVTGPQVALDAHGLATVIYMGSGGLMTTRELTQPNGQISWDSPQTIVNSCQVSPPIITCSGASYMSPDLAVDNSGNAIVALSIFDPTVGVDRASVYVTQGNPSGNWTPAQRLTDPTVPVDAYAARVAMSPDGTLALVGWVDHYHGEAQVSQLNTSTNTWGAARTIGRGTAFASFQEVLGLDAGSGSVARAIWKSSVKGGTRTLAASYTR